jgi:hypothetical protein
MLFGPLLRIHIVKCDIMTILKTRTEIVENKRIISSELTKMQKAFYDEEMLQLYKEDNEEHLYREQFDFLDKEIMEYDTFNKIIGLDHSNIETYTDSLTKKLKELFETINIEELIVVSHLKLDFFGNRKNKFRPLVNSYQKLEKIVGGKSYKEAFVIGIDRLPDFMEILFWTSRCDPSVSEFVFMFDKDEQMSLNLCKYGNLHISEFKKEQLSDTILTSLGWKVISGQEYDNFSKDGEIHGRQLQL